MHHNTMHRCSTPANNIVQCQLILNNSKQNIILVMTMIFFPYPKFFLSGISGSASFKGRISFLKPLLASLLRFSILFLFRCCICIFSRLCMRSHPALHTPSHARSQAHTTHPSILSHMRRAAGLLASPTRGRGWCPRRGVSLEEMNLAPQH